MSKMEFLDALEAKKLTKQKWEQYCGTPCMLPFLGGLLDPLPPYYVIFGYSQPYPMNTQYINRAGSKYWQFKKKTM